MKSETSSVKTILHAHANSCCNIWHLQGDVYLFCLRKKCIPYFNTWLHFFQLISNMESGGSSPVESAICLVNTKQSCSSMNEPTWQVTEAAAETERESPVCTQAAPMPSTSWGQPEAGLSPNQSRSDPELCVIQGHSDPGPSTSNSTQPQPQSRKRKRVTAAQQFQDALLQEQRLLREALGAAQKEDFFLRERQVQAQEKLVDLMAAFFNKK